MIKSHLTEPHIPDIDQDLRASGKLTLTHQKTKKSEAWHLSVWIIMQSIGI